MRRRRGAKPETKHKPRYAPSTLHFTGKKAREEGAEKAAQVGK